LLALVCAWLVGLSDAAAQPVAPTASPAASPSEGVQEAKPDLFYLKDKDGKLEPVLGFTLEDFERLMSLGAARDAVATKPPYRLDRISASGKAMNDRVELTVDVSIWVDVDDWVRVPLRMNEAVLRGDVRYDGGGTHQLEYDDDDEQYVVWLRGKSDKPHQLSIDVLLPLTTIAGETRFKLSVPRAVSSELNLFVPVSVAVAQTTPPAVVAETKSEEGGTRFRVLGLSGDFSLAYRQGGARAVSLPTVLEATGAMLVRLDGRSVQTQAQLTVRSYGGPFESFRVRLPNGAILISGDQPDYTVKLVSDADAAAETGNAPVVEVRLRSATVGPINVRLSTAQRFDTADVAGDMNERDMEEKTPPVADRHQKGSTVELGGFEIVGAVRQWGHMAVQVVGDWQVTWAGRHQVRQIEDVPTELWREDLLAGFEYFAQPFSLEARVLPRPTRMSAEAHYVARVGSHRVDLEANLTYRVSGSKAFAVAIDLAGWEYDEASPNSAIKLDDVATVDGVLTLPLAQPTTGEVDLVVRLHRDLPEKSERLEFSLPRLRGATLDPGSLVVQPADNVDLIAESDALQGLLPQAAQPTLELPRHHQRALIYSTSSSDARFVAAMRVFQRHVSVTQATIVKVGRTGYRVHEQLDYDVAREPLERVSLDVPVRVLDAGDLNIAMGDQPLSWSTASKPDAAAETLPLEVMLPRPRLGRFTISAKWSAEEPPVEPRSTVSLVVPLVMPTTVDESTQSATIDPEQDLRVQLLDSLWETRKKDDAPRQVHLVSTGARSEIELGVSLRENRASVAPVVDRAWIQSWLGEHSRQDRAVYRVVGGAGRFNVSLPQGVTAIEVLVDGERVAPEDGSSLDQLSVALPMGETPHDASIVELRYRFSERKARTNSGAAVLQGPTLDKRAAPQRLFWQVVLPGDEHLWAAPRGFTSENNVAWKSIAWDGKPTLSQSELETWVGATHESELPPATRQYLFSTTGGEHALEVHLVRRSMLVLISSGLVLVVGLGLLYWPASRHPALLLVTAVALAATASLWPYTAMLCAQAAVVGLLLVVVAMLMQHWIGSRRALSRPPRSGVSSIMERGSTRTQPHIRGAIAGSLSTTSAAKLAMPLSESEAKS
jgi:hypothetical protein